MDCIQLSLFGKTYPVHSVPTEEKISEPCWKNLPAWNNQTFQFLDLRGGGRWSKAGAIAGNGWSLAWRQLDAQYWGVPQRRKRIALVADFGGQRAAEILFERTSLSGNPCESIPAWKTFARTPEASVAGYDRMVESGNSITGDGDREYTLWYESKPVLVFDETVYDETSRMQTAVLTDDGDWLTTFDEKRLENVTHWMSLPAEPEDNS